MQTNNATLIKDSINKHGIFFQKLVSNSLKNIPSIEIIGEEYPISYQKGTALDLIASFKSNNNSKYFISLECKKGYEKQWIFFKSENTNTKLIYKFTENKLVSTNFNSPKVYSDAIEYSNKKANKDAIYNACNQVLIGHIGFVVTELEERKKENSKDMENILSFPMIITNIDLQICEYDVSKINSTTGDYEKDLKLQSTNYVVLSFPFAPRKEFGNANLTFNSSLYNSPKDRNYSHKEGIVIVNSNHIHDFFENLRLDKI